MRDDFSERTKQTLAKRVNDRCSKPDCDIPTGGPHSLDAKSVNLGVAAHITAASVGGPRYDPLLRSDERQSATNGIWLCQKCAKLIDSDEPRYTAPLIRKWKADAERRAQERLTKHVTPRRRLVFIAIGLLVVLVLGVASLRHLTDRQPGAHSPITALDVDLSFTVDERDGSLIQLRSVREFIRRHSRGKESLQRRGINPLGDGSGFMVSLDRSFSPLEEAVISSLERFTVQAKWYPRDREKRAIHSGAAKPALHLMWIFSDADDGRGPYLVLPELDSAFFVEAACQKPTKLANTGELSDIGDLPGSTLVLTVSGKVPLHVQHGTISVGEGQEYDVPRFEHHRSAEGDSYSFQFPEDADFTQGSQRARLEVYKVTPAMMEEFERRAGRVPLPLE